MLASTIGCLLSNSWILIWILLEINTLSFCFFLNQKDNVYASNESTNYFVIQSISSASLLIVMTLPNATPSGVLGAIALAIKLGSAPFQEWFINILSSLNNQNALTLISWQNLAPAYLLFFMEKQVVLLFACISFLVGAILQINKNFLIEILGYSSVFNLGWILVSISLSLKLFIIVTFSYWTSIFFVLQMAELNNLQSFGTIPSVNTPFILSIAIANLASIPPLPNFLPNWIVLNELSSTGLLALAVSSLLLSGINFYIYLNISTNTIINSTSSVLTPSNKLLILITWLVSLSPIIIILNVLGYAWIKDYADNIEHYNPINNLCHQNTPC